MNKTDIFNFATRLLGLGDISDPDADTSEYARVLRANFALDRDALFEMAPWHFAMERLVLTPMPTAPAWGYSQQYEAPAAIVRLWHMETDQGVEIVDYAHEMTNGKRVILANTTGNLRARGVNRLTPPTIWSPSFGQALGAFMAMRSTYRLSGNDETKNNEATKAFQDAMMEARSINGRHQPWLKNNADHDPWAEARR